MKRTVMLLLAGVFVLLGSGIRSYADDMLAGEPRGFNVAILAQDGVGYMLPSAIILDDNMRLTPLEIVVTNSTQKDHGFAIDKLKVKEVLKPGEAKTIKISVTDLDAIGTERSAFKYYCPLHKGHIGGQLVVISRK